MEGHFSFVCFDALDSSQQYFSHVGMFTILKKVAINNNIMKNYPTCKEIVDHPNLTVSNWMEESTSQAGGNI